MNKRAVLDDLPVDESYLYKLMRKLFPRGNDYAPFSGIELVQELNQFGVHSRRAARLLLKKYRRAIIAIDRTPAGGIHDNINEQVFGAEAAREFTRTRIWFAYPALIRLALDLEFGDEYRKFADRRDGISA